MAIDTQKTNDIPPPPAEETKEVNELNKSLLESRGRTLDGRPIWRIVWAPYQLEKQFGEWEQKCGPIFLRAFKGVLEVRKYQFLPDCWVIERLSYLKQGTQVWEELIEGRNGSYEPMYAFRNEEGPLPFNPKAVRFFFYMMEKQGIKSPRDLKAEELEQELAEVQEFEEIITNEGRSNLFTGDMGVSYNSDYERKHHGGKR